MARIYPLFSSSKGNASFIGTPEGGILIDAGVSARRLKGALERCGLSLSAVRGIFITHSHSDHISGLRVLCKQISVPVFAQPLTMRELTEGGCFPEDASLRELDGQPVCFFDMQITPFDTPHDTVQSCGYRIELPDGRRCAVCTDLGEVTKTVEQMTAGCDLVLLEANYDEQMLRTGPYPPQLQARIASARGHLSNRAAGEAAKKLLASGTSRLVLGHLSEHNNTPRLAETTVEAALANAKRGLDYMLETAKPETEGRMIAF
jgi:phosphoribosyl 1,2-cyclic phosphodiesterase